MIPMSEYQPTTPADLSPGQPFPDFALPDGEGHLHRLSDYTGRYLVLYTYPKDDTPGCTKQACAFNESAELQAMGAAVLGLSRDGAESHQRFSAKYGLGFPLLSDPEADFMKEIGAYGERTLYGKTTEGVKRQTFVIAPDGTLVKAWRAVQVEGHADAVAGAIREHQA